MTGKGHWDLPWKRRPVEEAINFNPAFCGELIFRAVRQYEKAAKRSMGLPLSFLVLPLVLHKQTRDELPQKADTAFVGWVSGRGPLLAGLPDRALRLAPFTREALLLMMQQGFLVAQGDGIAPGGKRFKAAAIAARTTEDTDEARSAAELVGRWFARQGQPGLVMQALGVKP
ncbi:MAG: hypothetical protein BGN89_03620 [Alphaproteobacteria bacterium 64-6]|nr:MAG: hypothetical protein BGN89_03620 [Alphaproteobacteria bacterium 64-6]